MNKIEIAIEREVINHVSCEETVKIFMKGVTFSEKKRDNKTKTNIYFT